MITKAKRLIFNATLAASIFAASIFGLNSCQQIKGSKLKKTPAQLNELEDYFKTFEETSLEDFLEQNQVYTNKVEDPLLDDIRAFVLAEGNNSHVYHPEDNETSYKFNTIIKDIAKNKFEYDLDSMKPSEIVLFSIELVEYLCKYNYVARIEDPGFGDSIIPPDRRRDGIDERLLDKVADEQIVYLETIEGKHMRMTGKSIKRYVKMNPSFGWGIAQQEMIRVSQDLDIIDSLVSSNSEPDSVFVVCSGYARAVNAVFNTLKDMYPEKLANIEVLPIANTFDRHATNFFINRLNKTYVHVDSTRDDGDDEFGDKLTPREETIPTLTYPHYFHYVDASINSNYDTYL